jgi:Cys-rich protein (TIGR01571 family)
MPCYLCDLTRNAKVSYCSICFGGLNAIRTKIRTERKIKGTIIEDFYVTGCCWTQFCSIVQMNREVNEN